MTLRLHLPHLPSSRPPPRWLLVPLAVLAVTVVSLGRASPPAAAGVSDYLPKLYLSGVGSTVVAGAYQLVNTQGQSTTARPTPSAAVFCNNNCVPSPGNLATTFAFGYSYRYTLVDATGGETSPSASVTAASVRNGEITVGNLPTGVTVRLYRDPVTGSANGPWKRAVELVNNASSTYLDNIPDASLGALLPQSQTRTATVGGTGYYEYVPGNGNPTSATSGNFPTPMPGTPVFDGKGWVVDRAGGVSFAAGSWSVTVKITSSGTGGAAGLDIGMWKVDDSGAVVGSPLVDPACSAAPSCPSSVPGANPSGANIATAAGTVSAIVSNLSLPAFKLDPNQHLYVQFWRHQTANSTGITLSTLASYDGMAMITPTAANGYPNAPTPGSVPGPYNATPQLSATFSDPDAVDTGTLTFQLCSDPSCATVIDSSAGDGNSPTAVPNGASRNWTPAINLANKGLYPDGTYYWRVQATDSAGNDSGWSSTSSFVVDTVPPTVSGVTASNANGAYNAGQVMHVHVGFSEPVTVTGSPKLALNTTPAESATYVSGSGTSTLTFDYTVQATDNVAALDYAGTGSLTLNGGSIADLATNPGILTLVAPGAAGSLAANKSIKIDTVAPTVSGVTASTANGAYDAGQVIHVQVNFSEPVNVTGSPKLALNTTPAESATYVSGSGSSTLTFDYTVQAGDNVGRLDFAATGSLTLNGGSIADPATNNATLTLVAPGVAGSLAAGKSIRIDTNPPGVPSPTAPANAAYLGAPSAFSATFSNGGDAGDSGSVHFRICTDSGCLSVVPGQTGSSASGLLNGASGSWTPSGLADGDYYWEASGVDAAGNQSAWSASRSFTLDTTAPAAPALGAVAARAQTTPQLSATFSDPPATDSGTLTFELCSVSNCSSILQTHTTSGVASNATANWTPPGLTDGLYYFRVQATDTASHQSTWSYGSFTVDTTPPGLPALVSPASALRVNSLPQLNATFVDSDPTDSGKVTFQLCSDGACSTVVASSTTAVVSPGAAVNWTPAGPLPDGTYYWRTSAQDVAGNVGAWSSARSFVLDTNPPGVPSLSSPADTSYLGVAPALTGIFTSGDVGDSGTLGFQVCSDSACTSVVQGGSSSSGLLNAASGSWTPSGLADGGYFWRARAQDAAGNQSAWSAARSFTLDTTAPSTPALGAVAARAQTAPLLSATFSDPGASDTGTLVFDLCTTAGCTSILQTHTASAVTNNASASWTPASLADGLYYYRVRATDSAGNRSAWASGSFTVDTVAPGLPALVSPASALRVNSLPQLNATFVDSDPTDSGKVTFQLCSDGACSTVVASSTTAVVSPGAAVNWTPAGPLPDGTYYWRTSAQDVAGNVGAWSSARSFVLDTTGPAVPTLGTLPSQVNSTPSLSASFSDPDAPDTGTVSFQVCSDSACTSVVLSGSSPAGIANGASGSWTAVGLAQGSYFWRARAQDAAGNQSAWSASQQFTLDTTPPPAATQGSFTDGVRLNQPPRLTAVFNDSNPGGTGSLTFEVCATSSCAWPILTYSGTAGSIPAGGTGSWTPAFLFDGVYYWRVQSVDSAGNASPWSPVLRFTVDATPPAAPVPVSPSGLRVNGGPLLSARVDDPGDPGDQARLFIEVCRDAACTGILADGYSATVPVGMSVSWRAPALGDGTYYWRSLAEDVLGNRGDWSATRSFVVDTVAPSVPVPSGLADAAVVNRIWLAGTFAGSDPGDTGTLQFQVCSDPECTAIVLGGSSAIVAAGATASWTGDGALLDDGDYFWRVRSVDAAGNPSAWSATRSFTLDQTPPGQPQRFRAKVDGELLTLSWRPPADVANVHGYALIVNGRMQRTLTPKTLSLRIHLRPHDRRSFAIAAVDAAGNMSTATRSIATYDQRLVLKQARSSAAKRHR